MNKQELDKKLRELGDEKYKAFHSKLKPSESEVIGVRSAEIRKLAKKIAFDDLEYFVDELTVNDSYEEKIITGMAIFYSKLGIDEKINLCKKGHQTQLRPSDRYDIIFFRNNENARGDGHVF